MKRSARRLLYITAIVGALLFVVSAGAMGVAAQEPDGDRTINETSLDPGDTAEVTLTITNTDQSTTVEEEIDSELVVEQEDFESSPIQPEAFGVQDDTMIGVWDLSPVSEDLEITYEVTVPEGASDDDFYTFAGTSYTEDNSADITGDDTITVGDAEPDEVLVDISTPEYVERGETYEAGVEVYNPTDTTVSGELVYTVDGEEEGDLSISQLEVQPDQTYVDSVEISAADELAGEVHAVEFEEFSDSQGVFSGVPAENQGDVTQTGDISISDAAAIQIDSLPGDGPVEQGIVDSYDPRLADVNLDGDIGISDAGFVQLMSLPGSPSSDPVPVITEIDEPDSPTQGEEVTFDVTVGNDAEVGIFTGGDLRLDETDAVNGTAFSAEPIQVQGDRDGSDLESTVTFTLDTSSLDADTTYEYAVVIDDEVQTGEITIQSN